MSLSHSGPRGRCLDGHASTLNAPWTGVPRHPDGVQGDDTFGTGLASRGDSAPRAENVQRVLATAGG